MKVQKFRNNLWFNSFLVVWNLFNFCLNAALTLMALGCRLRCVQREAVLEEAAPSYQSSAQCLFLSARDLPAFPYRKCLLWMRSGLLQQWDCSSGTFSLKYLWKHLREQLNGSILGEGSCEKPCWEAGRRQCHPSLQDFLWTELNEVITKFKKLWTCFLRNTQYLQVYSYLFRVLLCSVAVKPNLS